MNPLLPLWLIAGREFRAYVSTASFWIALAVGPLLMAAVVLISGHGPGDAGPVPVAVLADTPAQQSQLFEALREAGQLEGVAFTRQAGAGAVVTHDKAGLAFYRLPQLSPAGQALVARTLERDAAEAAAPFAPRARLTVKAPSSAEPARSGEQLARLVLVVMLWMTLTGSLGMLLQAVVRERSNRALESLLAAARPWQIAYGKLVGVGAVSALVLAAWLGSTAALAVFAPGSSQIAEGLAAVFTRPALMAEAAVAYGLAFGFFGLLTIAVGASAPDNAAAQNYARPVFALLLVVFGVAMTATDGGAWLVFLPPFAPFLVLLKSTPPLVEISAFALLAASTIAAGYLASTSFSRALRAATTSGLEIFRLLKSRPSRAF